jgi:hypothetical protein
MTNAIEGFAGLDALIHGESLAFQDRAVVASANTTTPLANAVQPTATDPLLPNMIGLADLVYGSGDDGTSTHSSKWPR